MPVSGCNKQFLNHVRPGNSDQFLLLRGQPLDGLPAKGKELVHILFCKGRFLCSALDFNVPALAGHHQIHIDFCHRVFGVGQIDQNLSANLPDTNRRQIIGEREFLNQISFFKTVKASANAMKAPVMEAVLVPPSA